MQGWKKNERVDVRYELEGLGDDQTASVYPDGADTWGFHAGVREGPGWSTHLQANGCAYPDPQAAGDAARQALHHLRGLAALVTWRPSQEHEGT